MRKNIKVVVVLLLLMLPASSFSKELGGAISNDVVISEDIVIKGGVTVEKGVTLTIDKGVNITFDNGSLEVRGAILALGTKDSYITFTGTKGGRKSPNGVRIVNSKETPSVLTYCKFQKLNTALSSVNSTVTVENSLFIDNQIAIDVKQRDETVIRSNLVKRSGKVGIFAKTDSRARIIDNKISDIRKFGIYIYRSGGVEVTGNDISKCGTGVMVGYVGSDPKITMNNIIANKTGVLIEKGANPVISSNSISMNDVGITITMRSDPQIRRNEITKNKKGIFVTFSSYPVITQNNIYGNEYAVYLDLQSSQWEKAFGQSMKRGGQKRAPAQAMGAFSGAGGAEAVAPGDNPSETVNAQGNYWGDDVASEMSSKGDESNITVIHDYYDANEFEYEGKKFKLDSVDYSSWADEKFAQVGE